MQSDLRELKEQGVRGQFFRAKPVVIEAFQMTAERRFDNSEWPHWLNEAWNKRTTEVGAVVAMPNTEAVMVVTLNGPVWVEIGDWIVRGVGLDLYPCKADVFAQKYEVATD